MIPTTNYTQGSNLGEDVNPDMLVTEMRHFIIASFILVQSSD